MAAKTETHIKDVAKTVFFRQGRFDARLHEIARAASVNKALLHYYFRDREKLLQLVYEEALEASFLKMFRILTEKAPFEKKVARAVEHMLDYLEQYPFIEPFIISQANASADNTRNLLPLKAAKEFTKKFLPEIKDYLKKKKIQGISPEQFLVNMMALCAYPASTKPLIRGIFNYSEEEFSRFMKERKKQVIGMILMES